jgi:hypothetical protein
MGLAADLSTLVGARTKHHVAVLDVPFEPKLPAADDQDEPEAVPADPLISAYAEGQTFAICYTSADGSESTRRITVWSIKRNSAGHIVLFAKCAERNATRSFRIDRIRYCIDMNGEVFEPPDRFLAEAFGLPETFSIASTYREPSPAQPTTSAYKLARDASQNELVVLSAMSECDGYVAFPETNAILDFVRKRCTAIGLVLTPEDEKKIAGYVRRLRPSGEQLRNALDAIERLPIQAQIDLLGACQEVMFADGLLHDAEQALLDSIRADLVGF